MPRGIRHTSAKPETKKRNVSMLLPSSFVDEIDKRADLDDRDRGPFIARQLKLAFKYEQLIDHLESLGDNVSRLKLTFISSLIREIIKSPKQEKTAHRGRGRPKKNPDAK